MTSQATQPVRATTANPLVRRGLGALRLVAAVLVFASIATQIGDKLLNDVFRPEEYFSYFTIQTSMANVVVFAVGGVLAFRAAHDPQRFTKVRMSMVAYAVVTAVVYEVLLRRIPPEGYVGVEWPNEVLHVGIPIFIVLDWLVAPGRPALAWKALWLSLAYPAAWLGFTILRGLLTGWYPYPFLEPDGPGGIGGVLAYILGIAAFVVVVAVIAVGTSRIRLRAGAIT